VKPNKKQKREFQLLNELQTKHGYTLREVHKGQRTVMVFDAKKSITPYRVCQIAVPKDSALAIALDEALPKPKKAK
jgi:hypothetical protein